MKRSVALLAITAACAWSVNANAEVIETNEWSNRTQHGWVYSKGVKPVIDETASSPSGGGALKFIYDAGNYSKSTHGGRAEFSGLTGREYYVGQWIRFSPDFVWHPIGTKINYQRVSLKQIAIGNTAAFTIHVQPGGKTLVLTATIQGNGQFAKIPHDVKSNGATPIVPGQWQWLEYRLKLNDVLAENPTLEEVVPNGIIEVWIDDVSQGSWNDIRFTDRQGQTWKEFQHSPEYGGGGAATIPTEQYLWVDHTVFSTERIGRPGIAPKSDAGATPHD